MHNYRAYMLDADRHIIDRIDLTCGDDESAKARAREFVAGHAWSSGTAGARSRRSNLVVNAKPASRGAVARMAERFSPWRIVVVAIDPGFAFGLSMDKAAAYAISTLIVGFGVWILIAGLSSNAPALWICLALFPHSHRAPERFQ